MTDLIGLEHICVCYVIVVLVPIFNRNVYSLAPVQRAPESARIVGLASGILSDIVKTQTDILLMRLKMEGCRGG